MHDTLHITVLTKIMSKELKLAELQSSYTGVLISP